MVHGNINKEGGTAQAVVVGHNKRSVEISDQFLKRGEVQLVIEYVFCNDKTYSTDEGW